MYRAFFRAGVVWLAIVLEVSYALTIDSQLADAKVECFIRVALGEKLPSEDSTRRVDSPSINKCERECALDRERCNSFSYGISAKGNGTCELSVRELPDNTPIAATIADPDFDIYAKRFNCNHGGGIQDPLVTPRPRPDPMFEEFVGYGGSLSNTDVNDYNSNKRPSYDDVSYNRPRPSTDGHGTYYRPSSGYGGSTDRPATTGGASYFSENNPGEQSTSTTNGYGLASGSNRPTTPYDVKPVEENESYPSSNSGSSNSYGDNNRPSYSNRPSYGSGSGSSSSYGDNSGSRPQSNYEGRPGYNDYNQYRPSGGEYSGDIYGGYAQDSSQGDRFQWNTPYTINDNYYSGSSRPSQSNSGNGYYEQGHYGSSYQYSQSYGGYGNYRPQTDYRPGYGENNSLRPMYDAYHGNDNYGDKYNDYRPSDYYSRPLGPERPLYYGSDKRSPGYENRHSGYRPEGVSQVYGQEIAVSNSYRPDNRVDKTPNKKPSYGSPSYGERIPLDKPNTYGPPIKKIEGYRGNGYDNLMPDSPIYNKGSTQSSTHNNRYDSASNYNDKKSSTYNEINRYDKTPANYPTKGSYDKGNNDYEARRPGYNQNSDNNDRPLYSNKGDKGSTGNFPNSGYNNPGGGGDKGYGSSSHSRPTDVVASNAYGSSSYNRPDKDRPDPHSPGQNVPSYSNSKGSYGDTQNKPSTNYNSYDNGGGGYYRQKGESGSKGDYGRRPGYEYRSKGSSSSSGRPEYGSGNYGGGSSDGRPGYGSGSSDGRPGYASGSSDGRPGYGSGSSDGRPGYGSGSSGGRPGYGEGSYGSNSSSARPGYGSGSYGSSSSDVKPGYGSGSSGGSSSAGRPGYGSGSSSSSSSGRPGYESTGRPGYGGSGSQTNLSACYRRVLAGKRVHDRVIQRVVPCERLEDCQRHCAEERRFDCETFNYRLDPSNRGKGVCELSAIPLIQLDLRKDFIEDRDYDFYELDRNSAPDCSLTWAEYQPSGGGGYPGQRPSQWKPGYPDRRYECSGCNSYRPGGGYPGGDRPGNDVGYYQGGDKYNSWKGWEDRDRNDYDRRPYPPSGDRRWDRGFVPYEIAGGGNDKKSWGQYGGSYGSAHGSAQDYWGLKNEGKQPHPNSVYPTRGVMHYGEYDGHRKHYDQDFNYNSLGHHAGGKWTSGHGVYGGGYNEGSWHNLQGLTPSKGYGPNDGSPRPDDDYYGPSKNFYKPYECSTRSGSGFRFNNNVVKSALPVRDVIECERFCFSDAQMKCKSYSFRYTNGPSNNCFLSERPYPTLDLYNDVQPDRDSDIYAMNPDRRYCDKLLETHAPGGRPGYDVNFESDCFWRYRSGKRFTNDAIKAAVNCASLAQCEEECIRITTFTCRAFSFREGPPIIGAPAENCLLSDAPASALSPNSLAPSPPCSVYERGSYGRGCEGDPFRVDSPYHRPPHTGPKRKKPDELCYLQYDTSAKLVQGTVRFGARLPTEHDCKVLCAQKLRSGSSGAGSPSAHFRCMSFSYSSDPNIPPSKDNCLLSDIQLRDLQPGVDYVPARTHWLFAYDMFDPDCEPVGPPSYSPRPDRLPPSGPSESPGYIPGRPGVSGPSGPPAYLPGRPGVSGPSGPPSYLPGRPGVSGPSGPPGPVGPPRRPESPDPHGHHDLPGPYGPPSHTHSGPSYIPGSPHGPSGPSGPSRPPYGPSGPGIPPPPSGPGYDDNRRNDIGLGQDTWAFFTVSGWPCRKGTRCASNKIAGYWSCEIEGGEVGSWDYCCHPAHHCGHSKGLDYPWCYVGESRDQWRPCSDKYYPYASGGSPAHQGGPSSAPWDPRPQGPAWNNLPPSANDRQDPQGRYPSARPYPPDRDRDAYFPPDRRPSPYDPHRPEPYDPHRPSPSDNRKPYPPEDDRRPYPPEDDRRPYPPDYDRRPYRPDPEKEYWDNLHKHGPQSYYDDCGNPRPGYVRVPTIDKGHIKYSHNHGPEGDRGSSAGPHWIPVRPPDSEGPAFLDPPKPGGFGTGRSWPVSYLHKNGPPNSTYYNYDSDQRSTTLRPNQDQTTKAERRKDDNFDQKVMADPPTDSPRNTQSTTKEAIVDGTRTGRDKDSELKNKDDSLVLISSSNLPRNNEDKKERIVKTKKDTRSNEKRLDDKLEDFEGSIEIFTVNEPSNVSDRDAKANLERILKEEKQIEEIGKSFRRRDDTKRVVVEKRADSEYNTKSEYKNKFQPIEINLNTSNNKNEKIVEFSDRVKLGLPDDSYVDSFYNLTSSRRAKGFSFNNPNAHWKKENDNNVYDTKRYVTETARPFSSKSFNPTERTWTQTTANRHSTVPSMKSVINNGQVFYEVSPEDSFEKKNAHVEKVALKEQGVTIKTSTQRNIEATRRVGGVEPITKDQAKRLKEIGSLKSSDDLTSIASSNSRNKFATPPTTTRYTENDNLNTWRGTSRFIDTTTDRVKTWVTDEQTNFGARSGQIKKVELNNYGRNNSTSGSRIVSRGRRNYRFSYEPKEVRQRLLGRQRSKESSESDQ